MPDGFQPLSREQVEAIAARFVGAEVAALAASHNHFLARCDELEREREKNAARHAEQVADYVAQLEKMDADWGEDAAKVDELHRSLEDAEAERDAAEAALRDTETKLGEEKAKLEKWIADCAEEGNSGTHEAAYHRARLGGITFALAVVSRPERNTE